MNPPPCECGRPSSPGAKLSATLLVTDTLLVRRLEIPFDVAFVAYERSEVAIVRAGG